jgi:hypothetical protein
VPKNVTLNAHGNVMIPDVMPSVPLFVNLPSAIPVVKNPKMPSVMLNVKDPIVKLCAPIRLVKWKIAPNVLLSVNLPIALLIAKSPNLNVKPFVKNPDVIGNVTNPNVPNLSANLFVKTLLADPNWNAVNVMLMDFPSPLYLCSKKLNLTLNVVTAKTTTAPKE